MKTTYQKRTCSVCGVEFYKRVHKQNIWCSICRPKMVIQLRKEQRESIPKADKEVRKFAQKKGQQELKELMCIGYFGKNHGKQATRDEIKAKTKEFLKKKKITVLKTGAAEDYFNCDLELSEFNSLLAPIETNSY